MIGKLLSKFWWRHKLRKSILGKNTHNFFVKTICRFGNYENLISDKVGNINLLYELSSEIGNILFFKGKFEKEEIDFVTNKLRDICKPVIFDVGANIGLHSLSWSCMVNNESKTYSFEPSKYTRAILVKNININKKNHDINVLPYAVGEHCGLLDFFDAADNAYSSLKDTKRKKIKDKYKVESITIDKFVHSNNIDRIDFLKVDVEGFETEVIKGAKDSLLKYKPDIFIEIYEGINSNIDANITINILIKLGYIPYILKNGSLHPFVEHNDREYNYYFIHKDKL